MRSLARFATNSTSLWPKARKVGLARPMSTVPAVMAPGCKFGHRVGVIAGYEQIAAGVEGQRIGLAQAGERDAGRRAAGGVFGHRAIAVIGHIQIAAGVKGQRVGLICSGQRGTGGRGAPERTCSPDCPHSWRRTDCRWSRTPEPGAN